MNEQRNLPQNQIRKAIYLKRCISSLEELQRRYGVFDEDPAIVSLLTQMRTEYETVMAELRKREDANELLADVIQEGV